MEDFKWRVWARRVAFLDVVVSVIMVLAAFFWVISLGVTHNIFIEKAHPSNENVSDVLRTICKMYFNLPPEAFHYLMIFSTFLSCVMAIFLIRANWFLLSATKSTPKHKEELNTAIEKCETWQKINCPGAVVYNTLLGILEGFWVYANGGSNYFPTGNSVLLKILIFYGIRLSFQYVVTKYETELKTKLAKRKRK